MEEVYLILRVFVSVSPDNFHTCQVLTHKIILFFQLYISLFGGYCFQKGGFAGGTATYDSVEVWVDLNDIIPKTSFF